VLFTTQRYDWSPRDNGIALFIVGIIHALVQGVLLGKLLKRWKKQRHQRFNCAAQAGIRVQNARAYPAFELFFYPLHRPYGGGGYVSTRRCARHD
jgi:predicted permease